MFHQCYDYEVTSAVPLAANELHSWRHNIQDTIFWQSRPIYIFHLIDDYQPARTLRSSQVSQPPTILTLSAKAFSVRAPSVWNSLSYNCRSAELLSTFRRMFKQANVRTNTESVQCHHLVRDGLLIGVHTYRGHDHQFTRLRDVIDHVTNLFPIGHFLLVVHWFRGSISNRF